MKRVIVTLRRGAQVEVEVPEESGGRKLERSTFGAIRIFPGVPKAISTDELAHIKATRPEVRLEVQPYVESKRVDRRKFSEAVVGSHADAHGLRHLPFAEQLRHLQTSGEKSKPKRNPPAGVARKAGERKVKVKDKAKK